MQWEKFGPRPIHGTYWLYVEEPMDYTDWTEGTCQMSYDPGEHWVVLADIFYSQTCPESVKITPFDHKWILDEDVRILAVMRVEGPPEPEPGQFN